MRADGFYPDNMREFLESSVKHDTTLNNSVGLVSPHAGYIFSGSVAGKTYGSTNIDKKRIIIIGPNHFGNETYIDIGKWETPLGKVDVDSDFADKLGFDMKESNEHSVEVQIPFLQYILDDFKIVPIVAGQMSFSQIEHLTSLLSDKNSFYVASSDFMHYGANYGYMPAGALNFQWVRQKDKYLIDLICKMNARKFYDEVVKNNYTVCGFIPITIIMTILKKLYNAHGVLIDYKNSYDVYPSDSFVSYAGIIFTK